MTKEEMTAVMMTLAAAFSASPMKPPVVALYEELLADLDGPKTLEAVKRLAQTRESAFLPAIGEIRALALRLTNGAHRAPEEAWGDVVRAIQKIGSYRSPVFKDPITAHAVQCMGWRNLCLGDSSEASDRARFCEIYSAALARAQSDETAGSPLPLRYGVAAPKLTPGNADPTPIAGLLLLNGDRKSGS